VPSGARTNAPADRDTRPIPAGGQCGDDRFVLTKTRRLVPVLLAGMLLVPVAGPAMAISRGTSEPPTSEVLAQAELDLVTLTNRKRAARDLVALRVDPDLMRIARDRAEVMATNDVMSHTEPNGDKVFDRIRAAGLTWYAAGEIIAWNNYPTEYSAAEAIRAWMASPGHKEIMVSTGYNYVGYGAAVSASGKRYYAGVFLKAPDETGAWAKFRTPLKTVLDANRTRVTIRWSGGDTRLQVLTSGLRVYQVERRIVDGEYWTGGLTTRTRQSITWARGVSYEVRIRALDRAGNWGGWRVLRINL
jgi:uncharacterized protein YkwD